MPASRPRRKADELLLAHGPLPRGRVMRELQHWVMPGQAARAAKARYARPDVEEDPRRGDEYLVGARRVANKTLRNAVRRGVWIMDGDMIRHRDWVAPEPEPKPRFVVPSWDELHGFARLLVAAEWERAAIMAAFVSLDNKPGPKSSARTSRTPEEFAALGIAGLKSKDTVRRYVKAWESTGLPRPTPGQETSLPTTPFPQTTHPTPADMPKPTPTVRRRRRTRRTANAAHPPDMAQRTTPTKQDGTNDTRPKQPKKHSTDVAAWDAWLRTQIDDATWERLNALRRGTTDAQPRLRVVQ